MAYQRWRRKVQADVKALAAYSTDDEQNDVFGQLTDVEESADSSSNSMSLSGLDESDLEYTFMSSDEETNLVMDTAANLEHEPTVIEELAAWATKHKATRAAVDDLLAIFRRRGHDVPKDARTLLKTPRVIATVEKCGGKYAYFGIEHEIIRIASKYPLHPDTGIIKLTVNVDGVPLFKSSSKQFWPILCSFPSVQPFIAAIFCGDSKPSSVAEYMQDFLQELQHLHENGITIDGKQYRLSVKAFVCDAPARAFLKCIKSHTGYWSCERCVIKGSYKENRVVLYSKETFAPRTDEVFNRMGYKGHQMHKSPLIDAGIPCIDLFPLDYMHLVCLGVVRRLLLWLRQGPAVCRLSVRERQQISDHLVSLRGKIPSEFARQPRSFTELDRWKATEFRQFLLYTGPIVLEAVLSTKRYQHFLALSIAMSILLTSSTQKRNAYLDYAKNLLVYFVKKSKKLYGEAFCVYNVHNLIHLPSDVEFFETSLNDLSGFQFENHLQTIKRFVRNSKNPIAQVAKRLAELDNVTSSKCNNKTFSRISTRTKDRCFMLHNEDFAFVQEKRADGKLDCDILKQRKVENFFGHSFNSRLLNIGYVRNLTHRTRRSITIDAKDITHKVICLPFKRGDVLFPLLHEVERP